MNVSITIPKRLHAALALLLGISVYAAEKEAKSPPPPLVISADVSNEYPQVPVAFEGIALSEDGRKSTRVKRSYEAALMPSAGKTIAFTVSATANAGQHNVKFTGRVHDDHGDTMAEFAETLQAAPGKTASFVVTITPTAETPGPFALVGNWQSANDKGRVHAAAGMASTQRVLQDFEKAIHVKEGGVLENSEAAAHDGALGLTVRPPTGKKGASAKHALPLNIELPGRPVAIGLWVKAPKDSEFTLKIRDPGVDFFQSIRHDRWAIGPIKATTGDWQYIAFPAPGYGKPKAERGTIGEANGVVDYPLTIEGLDIKTAPDQAVHIDQLELATQMEASESLLLTVVEDKPTGLHFPNDTVRLRIENGWLWGGERKFAYLANLRDIWERDWPLAKGELTLQPGANREVSATLQATPIGAYYLNAALNENGKVVRSIVQERPTVVFEPGAQFRGSRAKLHALLGDRHALLAHLGIAGDIYPMPWHSTDGSVSVEPLQGHYDFGWLDKAVDSRRDASLAVAGRLGYTPQWADPDTIYNTHINQWGGNVYTIPSRSIYWEEYVFRAITHFRDRIDTWVVWDRPDNTSFASSGEIFTERMLSVARMAADDAAPNIRLVSGGVTRDRLLAFLEELVVAGAGRYIDAVGILPTTAPLAPEDGYLDVLLARAQNLRQQESFAPPLEVLNLGWPTGDGTNAVSEPDQARYVARAMAICRASGIDRIQLNAHEYEIRQDAIHVDAKRDAAGFIYAADGVYGIKPAALAARQSYRELGDATFLREVFLVDRAEGMSRAYLFQKPSKELVLCAWRRQGTLDVTLPAKPRKMFDVFGNTVAIDGPTVTLTDTPSYIHLAPGDGDAITLQLERAKSMFADAEASAWKRNWTFFLDIGNAADEKRCQYTVSKGRAVGPITSHYHNGYGRRVTDSGRHYTGAETFIVDVDGYGKADLLLRKRINYAVPNQRAKVYCDDQYVGQWFSFKRDRRFRWRNSEFVVPNRHFTGKKQVRIRVEAQGVEITSYAYWGAPLQQKTIYASDLSLLVNSSGYGPGAIRDANILGAPMTFFKSGDERYEKGLGTNAAASFNESLVVIPLNKQYARFRARIGVDGSADGGTVRFRIGDGTKLLFDSQDMSYYSKPMDIEVDVSDAILLMLNTGDSGDGSRNDIANWANARLELK